MSHQRKPIGPELRYAVLERSGFRCHYCGQRAPEVVLHVDHIIPVYAGGTDDRRNLVAACSSCNSGKGHALPTTDRCPGEAHLGPFLVTRLGPVDEPGRVIVINCEACHYNVSWYTPAFYPFDVRADADMGTV